MNVILKSFWLGLLTTFICLVLGYPLALIIARCSEKVQGLLIMLNFTVIHNDHSIRHGIMIRDYLVQFDGFEFECVDKGFEDNEEIEVVLRPEDLDIVEPSQAKINGVVRNVTFKGVHYEILVETELRTYKVQTTDYAEVGRQVGLKFGPEDIHVMYRMGAY